MFLRGLIAKNDDAGRLTASRRRSRVPRAANVCVETLEQRRLLSATALMTSGGLGVARPPALLALPSASPALATAPLLLKTNPGKSCEVVVTWTNLDLVPGGSVLIDYSTDPMFMTGVQTTTVMATLAGTNQTSFIEGLTIGNVYYVRLRSMDILGTSSGSNVQAVVPVGMGPLVVDNSLGFNNTEVGPGGSGANELQLNQASSGGGSVTADGRLELTNAMNTEDTSAFTLQPVNVGAGFTTTFDFQVPSSTSATFGEGFAFVLQNAPAGPGATGAGAGSLGFAGIPNAAAVIFSTAQNAANNPTPADPQSSNTGWSVTDANGNDPNFPEYLNPGPRQQTPTPLVFNSGDTFEVIITDDASTQTLSEQIIDVTNLSAPTFAHTFSGVDLVADMGGTTAYVGFTAATSTQNQTLDILNWSFAPFQRPAPSLLSIGFGDDGVLLAQAQRSEVRDIQFTFDQPVTLLSGAVTLGQYSGSINGGTTASGTLADASSALGTPISPDGGVTWMIEIVSGTSFSDATGSLVDGIYQVTLHASAVIGNFTAQTLQGGDQSINFHRLFGDINGDKAVNNADFFQFKAAFGSKTGQANYNPDLDFDLNGTINNADFFKFKANFGRRFVY